MNDSRDPLARFKAGLYSPRRAPFPTITAERCTCAGGSPDWFGNRDQLVSPACSTCSPALDTVRIDSLS